MSRYSNNNFHHNINVGVNMISQSMPAEVVFSAMKMEGINAPAGMLSAAQFPVYSKIWGLSRSRTLVPRNIFLRIKT